MEHIRNFAVGLNTTNRDDDITIGEKRINRIGAAYGMGMLIGAATAVIAGGVYASAKVEEAGSKSREATLKCVESELHSPSVSSSTVQTIIARCRDMAVKQDLP